LATITKRNGRWFVQVRKAGHPSQSKKFPTKAEAREWAAKAESGATVNLSLYGRKERHMALGKLLQRYRSEVSARKRGATCEILRLQKIERDVISLVTLERLKAGHFADYRDRRLAVVAPATVARELSLMRHALEVARKEWGLPIVANPLDLVSKPVSHTARSRRLNAEEWCQLWNALANTRNRWIVPTVKLAIETGMRRGELLGLCWSAIDISRGTAHLEHTKNGHARTVPLTPGALVVLETLQSEAMDGCVKVIQTTPEAFKLAWQRAVKRAGLPDLHFHDLRHEAVSRLFELGLSMPEVATVSGHRDPRMLFRYTHLRAEELAGKLAKLTALREQSG